MKLRTVVTDRHYKQRGVNFVCCSNWKKGVGKTSTPLHGFLLMNCIGPEDLYLPRLSCPCHIYIVTSTVYSKDEVIFCIDIFSG